MNNKLSINIIGVSKRIKKYYSHLLKRLILEEEVSIGYIYNRSLHKAISLRDFLGTGIPINNLDDLKNSNPKNIAIVSLPSSISYKINIKLIKLGFNLFIETPVAGKLWQADILAKLKDKYKVFIGVGEDYCFSPESLLINTYCKKNSIPKIVENTGKSYSYHAFALFTTLYKPNQLPKLKNYHSRRINSGNIKIINELYEFSDNNKYILQSCQPSNYVARTLGELKLYYPNLTLTDRFYIYKNKKRINQLIIKEEEGDLTKYKSSLIKNWKFKKLHSNKSSFPLEESKTNGLYYNFLECVRVLKNERKLMIPYGIENATFDLFLSKIQYLNKRLNISNLFLLKTIILILKFLRKI